jgi:hypothetical protein
MRLLAAPVQALTVGSIEPIRREIKRGQEESDRVMRRYFGDLP